MWAKAIKKGRRSSLVFRAVVGEVEETLYQLPDTWKVYIENKEFADEEILTELHLNRLREQIFIYYNARLEAEENHRRGLSEEPPPRSMDTMVLNYLLATYGAAEIVHRKLRVVLQSIILNIHTEQWIKTFAEFCKIEFHHDKLQKTLSTIPDEGSETSRLFFTALTMCKKYFVSVDTAQVG